MIELDAVKTYSPYRKRSRQQLSTRKIDNVVQDLVHDYAKAIEHTQHSSRVSPTRVLYLRPSQLPFCPIEFFINHASKGLYRSMGLAGSLYVNMGTVVHTVLQQYLVKSGKILGNYKCHECGTFHKFSFKTECCDFPTEYHELEINYAFNSSPTQKILGHVDGVYRDVHGRYWVLDFKTTSLKKAPQKKTNPDRAYVEQVETYALLLRRQYKIAIEGVILLFVPRDDPTVPTVWSKKLTPDDFKRIQVRTKRYLNMHQEVISATTIKDALALARHGKCGNPFCESCKSNGEPVEKRIRAAYKQGITRGNIPLTSLLV